MKVGIATLPDDNHSTGGMIRAKCVLRKWLVEFVGRFGVWVWLVGLVVVVMLIGPEHVS